MRCLFILTLLLGSTLSGYSESTPFDRNVENTTMLNPACPVTLTGVYADSPRHKHGRVSVHLVNQTEKRVIVVKVGFGGLDAAWDKHDFAETFASAVNLKPEREARPVWQVEDGDFAVNIASGVRVYLLKLMYADGSTWVDDGTRSCSLSISGRAKPQPNDE
jgi:hypothetical protein